MKRYEVVFLVYHSKGPKLKIAAAAKAIKKSETFVRKWVNKFKSARNVVDMPGRGLFRPTTPKEDKTILRLFQTNPSLTLRQA